MTKEKTSTPPQELELDRVSYATAAVIKNQKGQFLVISNGKSNGELRLKPIGGAVQITLDGGNKLKSKFGVEMERDPEGEYIDLRLKIRRSQRAELLAWIGRRKFAESDPMGREIVEEISSDTGTNRLNGYNPRIIHQRLLGYHVADDDPSQFPTHTGLRVAEIYEVSLVPEDMVAIQEAMKEEGCKLHWVTREEIESGVTESGLRFARSAKALIEYKSEILQIS